MAVTTMRQLLEAGVHFGHQAKRWNPKMKRYIFTERNDIHVIDLQKTMKHINDAFVVVRDAVAAGGKVLFVGTKKQAQDAIREEAGRCNMYYVNQRWLGGMLTNFNTIRKSIGKLRSIEAMIADGSINNRPRKEVAHLTKVTTKLQTNLGGIKEMTRLPAVVFIVDTKKEQIAVDEANRLNIPIVGVVDTNCDPDEITHPIPANDDAIRAVKLLASIIADAVLEGKKVLVSAGQSDEALLSQMEAKAQKESAGAIDSKVESEIKSVEIEG
ncbi:MAG: 30S ribosomal protein S2 [Candidatus Margulisiibacteriota bacterium]|nr:MAG: 30S ribosomal protein S2 [Candidatus Margulisbacteria bacterium GWF2_38_17]OGI05824.1 MAG: 30S ribosomal protein S2 [Candidatus Margulisbacteria bacterium GWE2_39_32]PZM77419.1 MAG: 30S ribosomal protein S2 [Candidatus Margulisiibacteriota bacterium]HCY37554.1 30S ribosomal protein S2 [Candidatus Margulisiibacteriota bacterium]